MTLAALERIKYAPHTVTVENDKVDYQRSRRPVIEGLPQIFWADHSPWREANLWALERAASRETTLKTVSSNMNGLLHYANFLESKGLSWLQFPLRKDERCLVLYRGHLIDARDSKLLAPSTVSEYIRSTVLFYRWVKAKGMLDAKAPLWNDRAVQIRYFDAVGFERSMTAVTTDLAISNRQRHGERLEDGLLPVSANDRDAILDFAREHTTPELYRMLSLGFFTGMRIGSICDLKIQTLENASPDPAVPGLLKLNIGPGASPSVHTKFDVTGQAWIPKALLDDLLEYAKSLRRSKRQVTASPDKRGLLFLTRYGNPYCAQGVEQSSAINTEMASLRRSGVEAGLKVLKSFHFHQSRATFATELATLALRSGTPINAIALVREALLHKDESQSFKYIKFASNTPAKQAAANEFMRAFADINQRGVTAK